MESIAPVDIEIIESIRKLFSVTKQLPPIAALYILRQIQASELVSQKDLAHALHIRPQSVADHLRKMEREGLIRRKPDSKDRRISRVSITASGSAKIYEMEENLQSYCTAFFTEFEQAEKETLYRHLRKMIETDRRETSDS